MFKLKSLIENRCLFSYIVNKSLATGTFLTQLKSALVTLFRKKPNLDFDLLRNYQPVSNLTFLSRMLNRTVLTQLIPHMSQNCLSESMQSAYKKHHSPEGAPVHVHNDILRTIDQQAAVILALLDYPWHLIPLTTTYCYHGFIICLASLIRHWIGLVVIWQSPFKASSLAYALAPKLCPAGYHKDQFLAPCCLQYTQHQLVRFAESIMCYIMYFLMTLKFIYHSKEVS